LNLKLVKTFHIDYKIWQCIPLTCR